MPAWFNARDIDPATGSVSFPVGRHLVVAKSGARMPVKDKPNEGMLVFSLEIIDGQHKGFTGVYRLNIWNANPQAADIAARQLSAMCCVTGRFDIETPNASELFGIPFFIMVQQQPPPNDQYTQIVGVLDANGNQPVKGQGPSAPQGQPAQQPQQPQYQQQPPQGQQPQPGWGAQPGNGPAQMPQQYREPGPHMPQPGAAPSWGAPQGQQPASMPQQPAQQPAAQPSWNSAPVGGAPMTQPGQQPQPSWSQAPAAGGKPSWAP